MWQSVLGRNVDEMRHLPRESVCISEMIERNETFGMCSADVAERLMVSTITRHACLDEVLVEGFAMS